MTNIKQIVCTSVLLLLSTSIEISLFSAAGWASTGTPQTSVVLTKEEESDTAREGLPGRRLGGGTRSGAIFSNEDTYLTALVARDNLGITTASHPSFMFYVPAMVNDQTAEFVLRNGSDELVYETTLQIGQAGGIISLETATTDIAALNLNENYRWYFSIVPEMSDRANDVVVYGTIQRVDVEEWFAQQEMDTTLLEQISEQNPLLHAKLLRKQANLWHDAAVALYKLIQEDPSDIRLASEWQQLLEAVGLTAVPNTYELDTQAYLN